MLSRHLQVEATISGVGRKVDLDDLLDSTAVAAILGLAHRNSVSTYIRRYPDFPEPVVDFAHSKCRLWLQEDIRIWIEARR